MKFVIIDSDLVTNTKRAGQKERVLPCGQSILRINKDNEDSFSLFKKYTKESLDLIDLESLHKHESYIERSYINMPFKDKHYKDGSKLYENIIGECKNIEANATEIIRIKVPFTRCFFTEAEIINAAACSSVNFYFQVLIAPDTYHTVHQHGNSVNIAGDFYRRSSSYEAELSDSIYVCAEITNKSNEARDIGLNIVLHEAKQ